MTNNELRHLPVEVKRDILILIDSNLPSKSIETIFEKVVISKGEAVLTWLEPFIKNLIESRN